MYKISLSEIRSEIRNYNLKKILDSGENDMIDEHIDKSLVEELLSDNEKQVEEQKNTIDTIDLKKTLDYINANSFYESIINLKDKHVE